MPEGPEIRRAADELHRVLAHAPLTAIDYRVSRLERKARKLKGARIERVYSRGKALLIEYDCGLTHYSHNQLFGSWKVTRKPPRPTTRRSVRVMISTADHTATLYSAVDIELLPTRDVERHPYIARLGPDALDPKTTEAVLRKRIADPEFARRSLSSLLLDQHFVAGLGNYLRSDILFDAALRAEARPGELHAAERARLANAIRRISRRSYESGGITNDLTRAHAAERAGTHRQRYRFLAYGREGEPCWICGTRIVRTESGGRGIFSCSVCQPARALRVTKETPRRRR